MSDVLVSQAGPVLEILFNRPEKKNALTSAMYAAVADAFRRAPTRTPSIRRRPAERAPATPSPRATTSRIPVAGGG